MRADSGNLTRARQGSPPAVVAGAFYTGINLVRNLIRRGVEACCFDCSAAQPGFRSRYGRTYLCPNPDDHPDAWVDFMIQLARKVGGRAVLLPSADQYVTAIARHGAVLKEYYLFPAEQMLTQDLLATKRKQYEIAAANGLPVPRTQLVRSWEELSGFGRDAVFPCVLKPVHFREWSRFPAGHPLLDEKLAVVRNAGELEKYYRLAEPLTPEMVVQEVIEGPDTNKLVYLSCYSRTGARLASCVLREIRTEPMQFGSATLVEPVDDPETDRLCDNFLRRLGYVGVCEIELKRDSRTGEVKLIEVNPRYSGTGDAAPYLGLDLSWLNYLDLIGEEVQPVLPLPIDLHHFMAHRDFRCQRSYVAAGLATWGDIIRSYRRPVAFFDLDPYDWGITGHTLISILKVLGLPLYRKLRRK